jgi:hypothetical protein
MKKSSFETIFKQGVIEKILPDLNGRQKVTLKSYDARA